MLGCGLVPATARAAATPSVLLIDASVAARQPRLDGCDRTLADLHLRLDKAGAQTVLLVAPTNDTIRARLVQFARAGQPRAILFCGYASEKLGNIFALGSDGAAQDELERQAVPLRAFARVAEELVVADLHPLVPEPSRGMSARRALADAASGWSKESGGNPRRVAEIDDEASQAGPITQIARSEAATTTEMAVVAGAAPPPMPPVPLPATPPQVGAAGQPAAALATGVTTAGAPPDHPVTVAEAASPAKASAANSGRHGPPGSRVEREVRRIQVGLLARGLYGGRVDGIETGRMRAAVRHFQAELGHPATGHLTPEEKKQLAGG